MYLKTYKPKTPSLRFIKNINKIPQFNYKNSYANLFFLSKKNNSGRSNKGDILIRARSANKFNKYIILNNKRTQLTNLSLITSINYVNKNSTFIGLIKYSTGSYSYIKIANGNFIGDYIKTYDRPINFSFNTKNLLGCFIILKLAPRYCIFSNILMNSSLPKYARSAGTYLLILKRLKDLNLFILKLPTGIKKYFSGNSLAVMGRNSNHLNKFTVIGKAGANVNQGFKSKVRGIAMNPVDHPHGGRTKTNQPEMSLWGWVAKKNK